MAEHSGMHSEGLMQAVRRARIMNTMGKKLRQLDMVAAWVRHTTKPKCAEFMELLEKESKGQVSFVKFDRGQDSTAEAVEPDKGQDSTMKAEMTGMG